MDDASDMVLFDELVFTRARALSVTKALKGMFADSEEATDVETRVALYDKILKAEQALDRNIARIESIERSLLTLDVWLRQHQNFVLTGKESTPPEINSELKPIF